MTSPVRVGLAGAGPWAAMVHAPLIAAGPETELVGVWSRTPSRAAGLAGAQNVRAFATFDALLDACDAVAFAVVPAAQPDLAVRAAAAGKTLLLEKPLALDVGGAARIVAAVSEYGVGSMMLLTYRYAEVVRQFLREAHAFDAIGSRACFLSGAFLSGAFAGGWRLNHGALLDIGPHILDLVEAALGPVASVAARGDPLGWLGVVLEHESGAISNVSMSCVAGIEPSRTEVELYGRAGTLRIDARAGARASSFATVRSEFAALARTGGSHPCDAARGLVLQQLIERVDTALRR